MICLTRYTETVVPARSVVKRKAAEIKFESVADFLKLPEDMNFGEVPGVAVNYAAESANWRVQKLILH